MKAKLEYCLRWLREGAVRVVRSYPVETLLALYACIRCLLTYELDWGEEELFNRLGLVPLFFALALAVNNLAGRGPWRKVYWVVWAPIVPLTLWSGLGDWIESASFRISLGILAPLLLLLSLRAVRNDRFVNGALVWLRSGALALLFANVAMGLFYAILYSATYIFGLGGAWIEHVAVWSVTICETLAVPLLFLMMADRWRDAELRGSRILEMLLNYIVTPALLILACQWGLYLEASALRNAYHLLVLNGTVPYVASVTAAGVCRQQGTAEGFYRLCSKPDPARRWQNYALPLVLATAAVLSGVVCFSGGNMSDFPWVLTALTTAGAGLGIPLSGALPMYYLSRRLSRSGCAAAGYAGAKAVSRPRRLVLTDDDLFPAGTVTLNGYKVFGEERSRAVSYAASVARAADSSLTPLLERQLTAEGGFRLPVEWVNYCEEGGVEANIRGETVLMGSAYFMKKRKVALPRDMKLSTGVFLAVDGALTAVFAVKYQPSRNAEWALRTLKRFHIVPVLAVRSGNVTPGLIKRKFGVDAKPVYPDVSTRLALAQLAEQQGEQPCVAICREGLMPLVESVAGSRRAVKAVRTATILSYIGAAAGVALAYYLTSVGNFALLTPIAMVLYQVLWLLPTLLLAGLVKHY